MLRCNDFFKWNYEYEKSYWFDTSAMNDRNNTKNGSHPSHTNEQPQEPSSSSSSTVSSSSPRGSGSSGSSSCGSPPKQHHLQQNDLIIPREPTTSDSFSIKAFMNTTIKPAEDDTDGDDDAAAAGTGVDYSGQDSQQLYQLQKLCSITAPTGDDNEDQLSILFE